MPDQLILAQEKWHLKVKEAESGDLSYTPRRRATIAHRPSVDSQLS